MCAHHYYHRAILAGDLKLNESVHIKQYRIEEDVECRPGQYLMLWLPASGEIPLSPSKCGGERVEFLVENVGPTSEAIVGCKVGEESFIRGPFGTSFALDTNGPYLLVGGGTGIAPMLMALAELNRRGKEAHVISGGASRSKLYYVDDLKTMARSADFVTEDGSFGKRGMATDFVEEAIVSKRVRVVLTTGPEKMMRKTVEIATKYGIYSEVSIVRIIKCAEGVCGSCVLDPSGVLTCKDGSVLKGASLLETDFGFKMRDDSGRRIQLP